MSTMCDKCHTEVPITNDAVVLDALLTSDPIAILATPRHLLPVFVDGVMICPGSPDQAQYIKGQPRIIRRVAASCHPLRKAKLRLAYVKLQRYIAVDQAEAEMAAS